VRLLLLRHELGLTVDDISALCDVPSATWSTWERGTRPRDLAAVVSRIADRTGYDRDWLMWGFPLRGEVEPDCLDREWIEFCAGQLTLQK